MSDQMLNKVAKTLLLWGIPICVLIWIMVGVLDIYYCYQLLDSALFKIPFVILNVLSALSLCALRIVSFDRLPSFMEPFVVLFYAVSGLGCCGGAMALLEPLFK